MRQNPIIAELMCFVSTFDLLMLVCVFYQFLLFFTQTGVGIKPTKPIGVVISGQIPLFIPIPFHYILNRNLLILIWGLRNDFLPQSVKRQWFVSFEIIGQFRGIIDLWRGFDCNHLSFFVLGIPKIRPTRIVTKLLCPFPRPFIHPFLTEFTKSHPLN
jgi:hypothetical protein